LSSLDTEVIMRRFRTSIASLIVAVVALAAGVAEAGRTARTAPPGQIGIEVDVQLLLMVDVSLSMDNTEQKLQRESYIAAFRDALVLDAIRFGPTGRIAVSLVEWSGDREQKVVVPWMLVDGAATGDAFARALEAQATGRMTRTSISSALMFGARHMAQSPYTGARRVIDMSGDGSNNDGPSMSLARAAIAEAGIIVNGLPLLIDRVANQTRPGEIGLEEYYEACVIAGTGSFMIPVRSMDGFRDALKTKLILEIAGLWPDPSDARVLPASGTARPDVACDGRYQF
jgi:hypothetical protein